MSTKYFIKQSSTGRFYVQWTDQNGETWDADPEGFDSEEEAEAFREEIQEEERLSVAAAALDSLTENTDDTGETVDNGDGHVVSFRCAVELIVAQIPARLSGDLFSKTTTFRSQTAWRPDDLAELMADR